MWNFKWNIPNINETLQENFAHAKQNNTINCNGAENSEYR